MVTSWAGGLQVAFLGMQRAALQAHKIQHQLQKGLLPGRVFSAWDFLPGRKEGVVLTWGPRRSLFLPEQVPPWGQLKQITAKPQRRRLYHYFPVRSAKHSQTCRPNPSGMNDVLCVLSKSCLILATGKKLKKEKLSTIIFKPLGIYCRK